MCGNLMAAILKCYGGYTGVEVKFRLCSKPWHHIFEWKMENKPRLTTLKLFKYHHFVNEIWRKKNYDGQITATPPQPALDILKSWTWKAYPGIAHLRLFINAYVYFHHWNCIQRDYFRPSTIKECWATRSISMVSKPFVFEVFVVRSAQ